MIAVIQRCVRAKVTVSETVISKIKHGMVILLGVDKMDIDADADFLVNKILSLRIFDDESAKMNLSIKDVNGAALIVSQFTLCSNTHKGRRPSFINAALPEKGNRLYKYFMLQLEDKGIRVKSGKFGAKMDVELVNDGPVTFILNSKS